MGRTEYIIMYISPALVAAVVFLGKHRNRGTGHSLLVAAVVFLGKQKRGIIG